MAETIRATLSTTFTPTDAANYTAATKSVLLNVKQAPPATPAQITVTKTLARNGSGQVVVMAFGQVSRLPLRIGPGPALQGQAKACPIGPTPPHSPSGASSSNLVFKRYRRGNPGNPLGLDSLIIVRMNGHWEALFVDREMLCTRGGNH